MSDTDDQSGKTIRIKYFAGGLVLGGIAGLLIGNPFLGSCVGMAIGVIIGTKALENP
jgi:uncharacterized membrane protein